MPDTGNLGVSALCYSVISGLARFDPRIELTVFDEGVGLRRQTAEFSGGRFEYSLCGAVETRRYWQQRSFWNIRVSNWLGGLGNPAVECLRNAGAVLDISGGDSFTDLYGPRRFHSVIFSKRLALEHRRPLVLLPQTYGPYRDPRCRNVARDIVRQAAMAWARDARSFEVLRDLLGLDFDPQRHYCGVDVAFALEARPPRLALPEPIATWLAEDPGQRATPVLGFNVSGLIWHDPEAARTRYGFRADYRQCVLGFLQRALRETDARIMLVPHALTPPGHYESDPGANAAVIAALKAEAAGRLVCVPPVYDPMEMKWIISKLNWFCGTRMHATIAALSSGVPTAAIAYSVKTQGVFETCGQGSAVSDPRQSTTSEVVDGAWRAWTERRKLQTALIARLPEVIRQASQPMDIVALALRCDASSPVLASATA